MADSVSEIPLTQSEHEVILDGGDTPLGLFDKPRVEDGEVSKQLPVLTFDELMAGDYGEEYRKAFTGRSVGTSHTDRKFTLREFVRMDRAKAQQLASAHQAKYGRPDEFLQLAIDQVHQLDQNPISSQPEDPRYIELAYQLSQDTEYLKFRKNIEQQHLRNVFGTTDLSVLELSRYMDLASSDANMMFDIDSAALQQYRDSFPTKADLYEQREQTRIYADPDGVVNPDLDPNFPHYLTSFDSQIQLRKFANKYPEKAKAYAPYVEGLDEAISTRSTGKPEVPTFNTIDSKEETVTSAEEVSQRIKGQISEQVMQLSKDDLEARRKALRGRPQLSSTTLRDTLIGIDQKPTFAWVSTDKIVGRTWEHPEGWASEISSRKGRVLEIAEAMIHSDENATTIENVFHPSKPSERIKLTVIKGPAGPMYFVDDGTHRVTASMVAGLSEIPCAVKQIRYPLEEIAQDDFQAQEWQVAIERGLIDGEIQEFMGNGGQVLKKIIVRGEVLPWIRTTSQADLIKISKIYEQLYPGSLDHLIIPREALINPVANNFFMAGKWDEWSGT